MTTDVQRLFVLLAGYEILPRAVSIRGGGSRFILSEPVCAYLLETRRGWVLLDSGMDGALANDPALRNGLFFDRGMTPPVVRAEHDVEAQLARVGIGFDDVRHVILSHLHYDHCGHLDRLAHARISIQRREYDHAFGSPGLGYLPDVYRDLPLDWDLREGDWTAMPGLDLLDTRGHTAGHQSALVALPRTGRILLPFDAGDLAENFDAERLPGESCDDAAALRAIWRLNALQHEHCALRLLLHDPVAVQSMRLAPDGYD